MPTLRRIAAISTLTLLLASAISSPPGRADGQACLIDLERRVDAEHAGVASMLPQQFERRLEDGPDQLLVLDVRDRAEFDVSHIPGALRVAPDMTAAEFQERFAGQLAGKAVLLYCSVGVRSSRLVQRIDAIARRAGATGVYNLRGGIFAWHNYGLSLAQSRMPSDFVHPYSRAWARYLDFPDRARYTPGHLP